MIASENGNTSLVEFLLDSGADRELRSLNFGMNAETLAASNGHFSICHTIVNSYKKN